MFLQQIGRGLRKTPNKSGLTILDFIGQQRREFRFGPRFEILTHSSRASVVRHVEQDFPRLPAELLDLAGAEGAAGHRRKHQSFDQNRPRGRATGRCVKRRGNGSARFCQRAGRSGLDLDEIYARGSGWTVLRREVGFERRPSPDHAQLSRSIRRMRHIDDETRVDFYTRTLSAASPPRVDSLPERERRLVLMLHYDLWQKSRDFADLQASMNRLWQNPAEREEIVELLGLLGERSETADIDVGLSVDVPLRGHQRYQRLEVLGAMGIGSPSQPSRSGRACTTYAT